MTLVEAALAHIMQVRVLTEKTPPLGTSGVRVVVMVTSIILEIAVSRFIPDLTFCLFGSQRSIKRLDIRHITSQQLRVRQQSEPSPIFVCLDPKKSGTPPAPQRYRQVFTSLTHEFLLALHEILDEPTREHQIIDLIGCPRDDEFSPAPCHYNVHLSSHTHIALLCFLHERRLPCCCFGSSWQQPQR